jgi:hypothetical protein
MAFSQSMTHARLMGADSPKRGRNLPNRRPSRANALEGFCFPVRGATNSSPRKRSERPGSRGSRLRARARSAGPAGGNGAWRHAGHRWQGEAWRPRLGGAPFSRAPRQIRFSIFLRVVMSLVTSSLKRCPNGRSRFACSPETSCRVVRLLNPSGEETGYIVLITRSSPMEGPGLARSLGPICPRIAGSVNAGGEDLGCFAPGKSGFESRLRPHVPWRRSGRSVVSRAPALPERKGLRCGR